MAPTYMRWERVVSVHGRMGIEGICGSPVLSSAEETKMLKIGEGNVKLRAVFHLPRSARFRGHVDRIIDRACQEAEIYARHELGGVMVENMHDIPYVKSHLLGPETTASMTRVCNAVRNILPETVACGVQILAAGNREAIAVAQAASLDFIRAESFVFGHLADEGYIDSCAGSLLRYRRQLEADHILVLTDIKKKHSSHSITADVSITETAEAAQFFGSDGIILTGSATGKEVDSSELKIVKGVTKIPVIIGSGVTDANLEKFVSADAFIIGSHFKFNGRWDNALDEERIQKFMNKYFELFSAQ